MDKSGCISFDSKKYEAGVLLIGQKVNVLYDPSDRDTITIEHRPSNQSFRAKELAIGAHAGPRPGLPDSMALVKPNTSRLLDVKEKTYQSRKAAIRRAISFKDINTHEAEGGGGNV